MKYTKRQIKEAIAYWRSRLDESGPAGAAVDEIKLEDALTGRDGFEFAVDVRDVLLDGRIEAQRCDVERESVDDLERRLDGTEKMGWKKTYLCGVVEPWFHSVEKLAAQYGYQELDAGGEPENDDERKYVADRQRWFDDYVDDCAHQDLPRRACGVDLAGEPFLLKARRDGEGVGLLCRLVSFK